MRELLKKIIITTMAVLIALANVVTTMADDFNGAGTGDYTGDSTYEQVAVLSYYHYNQGFRCYIVNEKGVPVSGLVDFVKYRPWDIEVLKTAGAADTNEDIDLMWEPFFNRTGIWSNPGGEKYKNIKYIGGAKTDKWRVSTNDNALGKVYKDGTNPDGVGVCSIKRERFDGEESMEELKIEEAKMYTLADLYYALKVNIEADGYVFPFNGTHTKGSYQFRGNTYEVYNYMPAAIESINSSLSLTGTALKNMLMRPLNIEKYEADQSLVVQYLVDLYMVETDGLGRVKGGNYVPLFDIQDQAIKVYYNEVNEKYLSLSEEEKKETLNPMRDTMNHFNLKVAFERKRQIRPWIFLCNLL